MKNSLIAKLHQYSQPGLQKNTPSTLKKTATSGNVQQQQHGTTNSKMSDEAINENSVFQTRISILMKQIAQLEGREQKYLNKLSMLQKGLEQQYNESMKLQELYTDLLESYKRKQLQIHQLEIRYQAFEQSERRKVGVEPAFDSLRKDNQLLQELLEEHKTKINDLTAKLTESNTALANYKNAFNKSDQQSKYSPVASKLMEHVSLLQKQNDSLKQNNTVLAYQNQYLRNRHKDLQTYRQHMDRIMTEKQQEVGRLRDQKISILRNQRINLSPRTSSPRDGNISNRAHLKSLQLENKQLRNQVEEARIQICELNNIVAIQRAKLQKFVLDDQKNDNIAKHNDFFSFSKEQLYDRGFHNRNRQPTAEQYMNIREQYDSRDKQPFEQAEPQQLPLTYSGVKSYPERNEPDSPEGEDQLPPLPKQLQIDGLIKNLEKSRGSEEYKNRWQIADK